MNKYTKKILLIFTLILCIVIPCITLAYSINPDLAPENAPFVFEGEDAEYGKSTILTIIQIIIGSLLSIAAAVAILFIAWGGAQYIYSMGKQENMEKAKKTLIWAILGLLAVIFSFIIVRALFSTILQVDEPAPEPPSVSDSEKPTNSSQS